MALSSTWHHPGGTSYPVVCMLSEAPFQEWRESFTTSLKFTTTLESRATSDNGRPTNPISRCRSLISSSRRMLVSFNISSVFQNERCCLVLSGGVPGGRVPHGCRVLRWNTPCRRLHPPTMAFVGDCKYGVQAASEWWHKSIHVSESGLQTFWCTDVRQQKWLLDSG